MEDINIFISGDFAPQLRVNDFIIKGDYHCLYNDMLPIIQSADYAITNLETPLIEKGSPISKTGPNLKAPIKSVEALKYAGFDMVTLANNHMMDYGEEGLASTINTCNENHIAHIGAGRNLEEASVIHYIELKHKKLAFINCCENEWSTTQGNAPGCNPLDEVAIFYQIQEAKSIADFVILIIHGGHETYELPSPRMKKLYHWFIDLGIDAVIGHHTHCFSGREIYKGKPIIYSLGNFIFDSKNRNSSWNMGVAITITITKSVIQTKLYPFYQCNETVGIQLYDEISATQWLVEERNKATAIHDDCYLDKEFKRFTSKQEKYYRLLVEPKTCYMIRAAKMIGMIPMSIKGKKELLLLNLIRTESHRDILLKILKKKK